MYIEDYYSIIYAGQQSFIPSHLLITLLPSPFNGTDGSPSGFGSTCVSTNDLYSCTNNTDNPLFDCSASNNSYYGWDSSQASTVALRADFSHHFQSVNILMTFLVSTSSNVSAPSILQYAPSQSSDPFASATTDNLATNLPEGPYQHNRTLSSDMLSFFSSNSTMFNAVVIWITPDFSSQWVAINRIIFCAAATEGL